MQDPNRGLSLGSSTRPPTLSSTDFLCQTTVMKTFIWFTESTQGALIADNATALES